MIIQQNVALAAHSTMRLGGRGRYFAEVHSREDLQSAYAWAKKHAVQILMIGDGSNVIWRDEGFDGLVLANRLMHYEVFDEDEVNVYLTLGAGENWDSVVARSVDNHLTGIEGLSLIPGTCGAIPVQNVGAYSQDISQTLISVEVFDTSTGSMATISNQQCGFGYRTSRFKTADRGRFFITAITLHLHRGDPQPPYYAALQKYFDLHGISDITPQAMRDGVIALRRSKLPDPAKVANNGSFFANPIVNRRDFAELQRLYPNMPHWPTDNPERTKIPAAWLLEHAGFKDYHDTETGMGTWPEQPLVLVNEHANTVNDLIKFRNIITATIQAKFGITLEQEPEFLPFVDPKSPPKPAPKPHINYLDKYAKGDI